MQYQLPTDVQERLKAHVNQGSFADEGEVIRHAMDALEQLEEEKLVRWNERNSLSQEQSNAGLSKPLDESAALRRLRKRLADEGII